MEANKILSASILDLVFDGRNKEYGAYYLRVTYPERIKKSMIVVFIMAAIAIAGLAMANSFQPKDKGRITTTILNIQPIDPEQPKVIPPPIPPKPVVPEIRTVQFTTPVIVNEDQIDPPPTQDEIDKSKIDVKNQNGIDDIGIEDVVKQVDNGKGIIEPPKEVYDGPVTFVEIDAKFNGNWEKFLRQNLNPDVPVENGAPVGKYNVIVQFVVDLEGNVSDIKPLTAHGYGMEAEAVRVLKKAVKWEPAIQNGRHVKAYRRQPITFVVDDGR